MPKVCFQCSEANAEGQAFCGQCGSPLALKDYVGRQVQEQLQSVVRDRDILETESSIRIFERTWGWVSKILQVAALLVAIVGGGVLWKASDFWSAVNDARKNVTSAATGAQTQIATQSTQSVGLIKETSKKAIDVNNTSVANAKKLTGDLEQTASRTKAEISKDASNVHGESARTEQALKEVSKIQPEFEAMRIQLGKATSDLANQQKAISSSEEFIRHAFEAHRSELFSFAGTFEDVRFLVIPATGPSPAQTLVFLLLQDAPIPGTLQLQYHVFSQPPGSFSNRHNLVIFFWGDPANNLKDKLLSVSYIPDTSDKTNYKKISKHDGSVWADDTPVFPLPK